MQEFHGQVTDPCSLGFPSECHAGCRSHSHVSVSPSPDSEVTPSCVGDMADNPRDAMLKQAPASRNEKAPMEFGYVGIDSILEQMRRKAMKQGFEFNIMVVGECYRPFGGLASAPAEILPPFASRVPGLRVPPYLAYQLSRVVSGQMCAIG